MQHIPSHSRVANVQAPSLVCVCVCVCVRSASKLQGGNGEFPSVSLKRENSDGMDKQYWMTRANEVGTPIVRHVSVCHGHTPSCPSPFQLSLQLQQCTEFWSEKVRLLSSQLEETGKKKP